MPAALVGPVLMVSLSWRQRPPPPLVLERLRCPECQQPVESRPGGLRCPTGHVTPQHDGYIDARPSTSSAVTTATFESFGYEWTRFPRVEEEDEAYWRWYFADVDLSELEGRVGLDAGCGKGRYSVFTAAYLDALIALDGSDAVEAAAANLAGSPTTTVLRADLRHPPLTPESFGFISCLGVLHHLEEPEEGFDALARLLEPGGHLLVYLYSRPSGPGLRAGGLRCAALLRRLTTGMPAPLLRLLSWPLALVLWSTLVRGGAAYARRRGPSRSALPLAGYRGKPMRSLWLDTFDRLSAPIEHRFAWDDVRPWYDKRGLVVDAVREDAGMFILAHRP